MQLGTEWDYSWQSSTKVFNFKITFYALLCHINISSQGENPDSNWAYSDGLENEKMYIIKFIQRLRDTLVFSHEIGFILFRFILHL